MALAPFVVTTLASFKTTVELVKGPFQPPEVWQWQNYVTAWTDGNLDQFFLNSLVVAVLVVVPSVFLSAMTGYAFARFGSAVRACSSAFSSSGWWSPYRRWSFHFSIFLRELGLLNSLLGSDPAADRDESVVRYALDASGIRSGTARDRRGVNRRWGKLMDDALANSLPLTRPVVGTLALMLFIWTWNEFLLPLVVSIQEEYWTLPVGLLNFQAQWTSNLPVIAAGSTIIFLPLTVVFLIFQRQLVEGITSGAVKGSPARRGRTRSAFASEP